jgi:hypothetical protein
LYGECQATLINLEQFLTTEFGPTFGLSEQLVLALQFSSLLPDEKRKAFKATASSASKGVSEYIDRFRASLPASTRNSMSYSFSVYLVPRVANRATSADYIVQFVKVDEANKDELERLERLNVLIRDKHIPIANLEFHKPTEVVKLVQARIPFAFSVSAHAVAWRYHKVWPAMGDAHPEQTVSQYCIWDRAHRDYVYTDAWVERLSVELGDPTRFEAILGGAPMTK